MAYGNRNSLTISATFLQVYNYLSALETEEKQVESGKKWKVN